MVHLKLYYITIKNNIQYKVIYTYMNIHIMVKRTWEENVTDCCIVNN